MISIIVPVYNEEEVLSSFIKTFFNDIKLKEDFELILVNDGSEDNTKKLIMESMTEHKEIKLVSYDKNKGLGYALRTGFNSVKGRIIVTMDSDLTHPPVVIPKLVRKIDEGYDVVIGSRYIPSAGIEGASHYKNLLSRSTNKFTKIFVGGNLKDLTSGFRAYNTNFLKKIKTKEIGFEVELEILVKLIRRGAKIVEIPFTSIDRQAGKSKFSIFRHGIRYIFGLMKILIYRRN
jgi:dolichol-phosphate mannosyltransferase